MKVVRVLFEDGRILIDHQAHSIITFNDTVVVDGLVYTKVRRVWVGRV